MDINEFWVIIENVRAKSNDIDERMTYLHDKLMNLTADEILSFGHHFEDLLDRAYNWDLWAAAYIIQGGCSDDGFWDFRSALISTGNVAFEKTLSNPDSLIEFPDYEIDNLYAEGFQYINSQVYEKKKGFHPERKNPQPEEPSGNEWDEDDEGYLKKSFPRLFAKYWDED